MARKKKDDDPQNGVATEPPPTDKPLETNGTPPEVVPENLPVEPRNEPNRPCKSFSCVVSAGVSVEAAIWPKQITVENKEVTVYSTTVRKSYRKEDGSYDNTNCFRGSEIHVAVHLMRLAETWIMQQRTEETPPF